MKSNKIILITTVLYFLMSLANAQVKNQIIVQFVNECDFNLILKNGELFSNHPNYKSHFCLSKTLNIGLVEYEEELNINELIQSVSRHPKVKFVQQNSIIEKRDLPNDELFYEQWQYNNNGSNNGKLDADIDATEAWQITKGGKTYDGTDIVIAIIDNGILLHHPDLVDNIWVNKTELRFGDNCIDDDNNGYVDDFYGWNFSNEFILNGESSQENNCDTTGATIGSSDVSNNGNGNWHGTAVAGIIGATGNNEIGVTGVNWNVKIMNMVKSNDEASVVAAYDYILQMRKRFNETNGKEGAFVVATNASFGKNYGKAEDSPIWCNIYNELGKAGIINIAATANLDIDVDKQGDVPTTCTSEFIIGVTNTTNSDEKESTAAVGRTHIDLGAPGTGSFTVANKGGYRTFGGTSAATPHVAGAVGLLYALLIPKLIEDIKQDPAKVALIMKEVILNGTDPVSDLKNKTISGGRLNIYRSMQLMQKKYGIELNNKKSSIKINEAYPNPTKGDFYVDFEMTDTEGNIYIRTFNTKGQLIQSLTQPIDEGKHQIKLSLNQSQTGIYFINLKMDNFNHTLKVKTQ